MSILQARFDQTANENKRYMWDYTADLSPGETVTSLTVNVFQQAGAATPALVVNNVVIAGDGVHVVFYVSGGAYPGNYEIQFLATTSIAQIFEDIVGINITSDL